MCRGWCRRALCGLPCPCFPSRCLNVLRPLPLTAASGTWPRWGACTSWEAPTTCILCDADLSQCTGSDDTTLAGHIHSTLGPCGMQVVRRQCSSCGQRVSREGRSERLILLSLTSACTTAWARACAEQVRSGTHISDVLAQCYSSWAGLRRADLLPQTAKARGSGTLRALILTFMRLTSTEPDGGLYDCSSCRLACGRYLVVTADCICLGFDAQAQPFSFEHVHEAVPPVNTKGREGCMVVGEQARRMLRHVVVPDDPAAVTDRTLPSAELALSCVFPLLPAEGADAGARTTAGSASIRALLAMVWNVEAAALPLAESLLLAYGNTQVKALPERQRRAARAERLKLSIANWRKRNPDAVAEYDATVAEVRAEKAAAAAAKAAGVKQSGGGGGTPASARRRSHRQRQASSSTKAHVMPGEESALNIPMPLLQPVLLELDDNEVDHICRMVLAFTLAGPGGGRCQSPPLCRDAAVGGRVELQRAAPVCGGHHCPDHLP